VQGLIPKAAGVFLEGDCEFGSIAVMRQLDAWGWFYALRQKSDTHIWLDEGMNWRDFGSFVHLFPVSKPARLGHVKVLSFNENECLIGWVGARCEMIQVKL
jgi:hypothetical protein